MSKQEFIKPFVDKIKQDKLDQRRTVLSEIDQEFVNSVGALAEDAGVELEPSVAKIVEAEAEVEEYPALSKDVPKRDALIAAGAIADQAAKALSKEELIALDDIGDVSADKIIEFYAADETNA